MCSMHPPSITVSYRFWTVSGLLVGNMGGVLVIRIVEQFYDCGSKVPNQQLFAIRSVFGVSIQIECALQFVYWNANFLPSDGRNASKGLFSPREFQKVQHVDIDFHRQNSFRWGSCQNTNNRAFSRWGRRSEPNSGSHRAPLASWRRKTDRASGIGPIWGMPVYLNLDLDAPPP